MKGGNMKKTIIVFIMISLLLFVPHFVNAEESNDEKIFEITKYYKTITNGDFTSESFEISKEEYDNYDVSNQPKAIIETTYKNLTSTITQNGSFYRYKAVLNWKNMPSKRSYDIIGIGFYASVKVVGNFLSFNQYYCFSSGSCTTTYVNYPQIFTGGAGTTFSLPTGNLTTLRETFYFDVEKNTTATIISQLAAADYAHATSTISLNNAKKYTVSGATGIVLNGVSSYYDAINPAKEYWSGSW
jgi:hypothetical protein